MTGDGNKVEGNSKLNYKSTESVTKNNEEKSRI